jgi:hypothetical protein
LVGYFEPQLVHLVRRTSITDGLVPLPIRQRLCQRQAALKEIIVRHQATRIHWHSSEDSQ